jgi:hypothetical protein
MHDQEHDALVEMSQDTAHVWALSTKARQWIEIHVTLDQVEIWTGKALEIAPHYMGDLIAGMLADGLKVTTSRGSMIEPYGQYGCVPFMTPASQN